MTATPKESVRLASWEGGWTFERILSRTYALDNGISASTDRSVFVLRYPSGRWVFQFLIYEPPHRFVDDFINVTLPNSAEANRIPGYPGPEARRVALSELMEVLDIKLPSRYSFQELLLLPKEIDKETLEDALQTERQVLDVPDSESLDRVGPGTSLNRKIYMNQVTENFRWSLNLNRFRHNMRPTDLYKSADAVDMNVIQTTGLIRNGSVKVKHPCLPQSIFLTYELFLKLDFLPGPLWTVGVHDTTNRGVPVEILGTSAVGPVDALVKAGLLIPGGTGKQQAAFDTWAQSELETAPEVFPCFDMEPYRLVGVSSPLIWPIEKFNTWLQGQTDER